VKANRQISPKLTLAELQAWLQTQSIDTTNWDHADAKSVADLLTELQHGESTLHSDPPLRRVRVVEVLIRNANKILIEQEQHFADGRVRLRNRPPSEKMHPDETPLAAAQRCLSEELALSADAITFPPQQIPVRTVCDESGSYPNLTSEYCFYTVVATVQGLPTDAFMTTNAAHLAGDPVVAHSWSWRDA